MQRNSLRDSLETDRKRLEQLEGDIAGARAAKRQVSSKEIVAYFWPVFRDFLTKDRSSLRQAIATLANHQKWWRFYDQLKNGTYRRKYPAESLADAESRVRQRIAHLVTVTDTLANEHPHLATKLVEIRDSLN